MNRRWKQPTIYLPILVAALTALVLLAVLQYRWVGQVSEGERERMRTVLRAGVARFGEDFDRELARLYLTFQMDATTLRDRAWERYAQRYDHWAATAPYAQLVDAVYLAQVNDRGTISLERYNTQQRRFEPIPWPESLSRVRQRLAQSVRTARVESGVLVGQMPEPIAAEVPALMIPVSRTYLLSDTQEVDVEARFMFGSTILRRADRGCIACPLGARGGPLFAHTLVTLKRDYLTNQFVPELAHRHFGEGASDYTVAIVSRDDPVQVVYRSDPQMHNDPQASGDATVDILAVRLDELNRFLLDNSLRLDELDGGSQQGSPSITIGVLGRDRGVAAGGAQTPVQGQWQLIITHRAGSLEAAVAGLRQRNLALSFSTLLLLTGSLVLLVMLTRRTQRLAQQKFDFVTAVSHELRTPLAVIVSAGENLADGIIHEPQQARQYGAVIRGEGQRLAEMVEQVMEFAGVQSGRKTYELTPVDVTGVVERALAAHRLQLNLNGFIVEQDIPADLPLVLCDASALRNAVQNLIGNAIKYGAERRWLSVRVRALRGPRGPEVQISVEDRGMGIPAADLPYIFEPFYRGRDVVAAQIHGSGLGLGLVKHVVEAHGGRVSVQSTPEHGSTFTLHLPALPAPATEQAPATA